MHQLSTLLLACLLLVLCGCQSVSGAAADADPTVDPAPSSTESHETTTEPPVDDADVDESVGDDASTDDPAGYPPAPGGEPCAGGVILDDGVLEAGYGFVPSAKYGQYLQRFDSADFESRQLDTVCVCWLRGRPDEQIDYQVVFHRDAGGRPAAEPYASRPGRADEVPYGRASGGRFDAVDVDGVEIPEGPSYIGVRFNPGKETFFFVCADQSPATPAVPVFQQEDRAPAMTPVIGSRDPLFAEHKALLLRAKPKPSTDSQEPGER